MRLKGIHFAMLVTGGIAMFAIPGVIRAQDGPENVAMSFGNLAVLDEGAEHYEGWAIVDGSPVSTGVFNVNEAGLPVELGGGPVIDQFDAGEDIHLATAIVITIEPADDPDPGPSSIKILAGMVESRLADLRLNVPGREMLETSTTAAFILATPSDNPNVPDNDDMGIWYLTLPGPEPGFMNLPDIGPDWTYEGWVVDVSGPPVPYSSGTFAGAEGADSDEAGCMGGGPPFPGQDFVPFQCGPVLDLDTGDFVAVISIEPVPDDSPAPFQVKPLVGEIPTDALGQNNMLGNVAAETFPLGMAQLYTGPSAAEQRTWGEVKNEF